MDLYVLINGDTPESALEGDVTSHPQPLVSGAFGTQQEIVMAPKIIPERRNHPGQIMGRPIPKNMLIKEQSEVSDRSSLFSTTFKNQLPLLADDWQIVDDSPFSSE